MPVKPGLAEVLTGLCSASATGLNTVIGVCRNVSWCTVLGQNKSQANDTDLLYCCTKTSRHQAYTFPSYVPHNS